MACQLGPGWSWYEKLTNAKREIGNLTIPRISKAIKFCSKCIGQRWQVEMGENLSGELERVLPHQIKETAFHKKLLFGTKSPGKKPNSRHQTEKWESHYIVGEQAMLALRRVANPGLGKVKEIIVCFATVRPIYLLNEPHSLLFRLLHNATQCYTMLHNATQCYTMLLNATQCY